MDEAFVGEVAHPSGHLPAEAQQDGGKLERGCATRAAKESALMIIILYLQAHTMHENNLFQCRGLCSPWPQPSQVVTEISIMSHFCDYTELHEV